MPSAEECLRGLSEADIEGVTSEDLERIIITLNKVRQDRAAGQLQQSIDEMMGEAAEEVLDNLRRKKLHKKLNLVRNRLKIKAILDLEATAFEATGVAGNSIRANTVGVSQPFEGARNSVDYNKNALTNHYMGLFHTRLQEENLLTDLASRSNEFENSIFIEKEMVERGRKESPTGDKKARRIAEIMFEVDKIKVADANRAGAFIDLRKGWLAPVRHDVDTMVRRADRWKQLVMEGMDWDAVRVPVDKRQALVDEMYSDMTSAQFSSLRAGADTNNLFDFVTKSVDVAKRESAHRHIVWKNAKTWLAYNKEFGQASPIDAWMSDLHRSAATTALMWRWGTNPMQAFQEVRRELQNRYRGNPAAEKALGKELIGAEFAEITGEVNKIVNMNAALFGRYTRSATSAGLLAKAGFMTLLDIPAKTMLLRRMRGNKGFPLFEATFGSFKSLGSKERKQLGRLNGVGLQVFTGEIGSRYTAMDQSAGMEAKAMRLFFKYNLLAPFTDANQTSMGAIMGTEVARMPKEFGRLEPLQQQFYRQYGIGEREWTLIHDAVVDYEGTRIAVAGEVLNVRESKAFEGLNPREIVDLKDRARIGFGSAIADMVESATLQSGARERAIWRRGLPAGTMAGEAARFIGQFKGPATAILTRIIAPALRSRGAKSLSRAALRGEGDIAGVTGLIASLTLFGVMIDQFFQLAEGRTPREWDDPELWADGFVRGGSGGIFADLLLFEAQRYGQSLSGFIAGPAPAALGDQAFRIYAKARDGENVSTDLARFFRQFTPDVIYMQAALDYLIWYQVFEYLNPGYLARMERGFKSDRGQEFFVPPSRAIPRGGGDRLGEGVR